MQIKYSFPYWGSDHLSPSQFITNISNDGFDGAELLLQPPNSFTDDFLLAIENIRKQNPDFYFITLQLPFPENNSVATLLPFLKKFPGMELVGDFSHFCTVSESMLEDQENILQQIIPHVSHIHARVGFEQGPQVNNPAAPEWESHLNKFIGWWQQIIDYKKSKGDTLFTISPEFGPDPYMPVQPFTKEPLSNQWNNNVFMKNTLKQKIVL